MTRNGRALSARARYCPACRMMLTFRQILELVRQLGANLVFRRQHGSQDAAPQRPPRSLFRSQRRRAHVAVAIARSSVGDFDRMEHTVAVKGICVASEWWEAAIGTIAEIDTREFAGKRSLHDLERTDINLVLDRCKDTV